MATFTVTTTADVVDAGDGVLSLREAVTQANATTAADTIVFASAIEGQALMLTGGELVLNEDTNLDGDQNNDGITVTLDGNRHYDSEGLAGSRILRVVGSSTDIVLADITLQNGIALHGNGGAMHITGGSIDARNVAFVDNHAGDGYDIEGGYLATNGGAIYASLGAEVSLNGCALSHNFAFYGRGGGIYAGRDCVVTIRNSRVADNHIGSAYGYGGGLYAGQNSSVIIEDSLFSENHGASYGQGGAILVNGGRAIIARSAIIDNGARTGGGILERNSQILIENTTIANNGIDNSLAKSYGAGLAAYGGIVTVSNSTITGNIAHDTGTEENIDAAGIFAGTGVQLEVLNSLVLGNRVVGDYTARQSDIGGTLAFSNGHNVFGTDVAGNASGDRENIAAAAVFAAIDPDTGGGLLNSSGIVPLRNSIANPALSGADPLAASATGQLGGTARPLPAGSLPDIGSIEINQALSTTASANNDLLTGTAAANTINGLAGADYLKGLGGKDTLRGGDGGDVLDGGAGNDKLYGDAGIDLVFYGGSTKVTVDLSLATDKATRGSEVDTLYNVEGAIGSSAADTFKGNEYNNYFQGGLGKDTATGGSGRDLYDFNAVADSTAGATTRDVITDFAHLIDKIDVMGIDADTTVAGNQAFRWVGTAALTGAGQIGYFTSGGNTIIRASTDADAASEFEIQLTGIKPLTAVDFYL